MLVLQRLPVERQRNVGAALADIFKGKTSYHADVVLRAKAVIAATATLAVPESPSMFTIDRATDSVVTAIHRILAAWHKGLTDAVVPLNAEQEAALAAAEILDEAWFANGIGFIHELVGLQCDALLAIQKTLREPEIQKAIKTLGLGPLVEHMESHTALYAKALGLTADSEVKAPEGGESQAWHDAFVRYAASVLVHYPDDAEAQRALLGSYEKQLQEHRAALQRERRRQRAKKKDEG